MVAELGSSWRIQRSSRRTGWSWSIGACSTSGARAVVNETASSCGGPRGDRAGAARAAQWRAGVGCSSEQPSSSSSSETSRWWSIRGSIGEEFKLGLPKSGGRGRVRASQVPPSRRLPTVAVEDERDDGKRSLGCRKLRSQPRRRARGGENEEVEELAAEWSSEVMVGFSGKEKGDFKWLIE